MNTGNRRGVVRQSRLVVREGGVSRTVEGVIPAELRARIDAAIRDGSAVITFVPRRSGGAS